MCLRLSRRLSAWRNHRADCGDRVPLKPVVDVDERPVLRPRCLSLRYQRPASGLRSQTSSRLIGAVISVIVNRKKPDEIDIQKNPAVGSVALLNSRLPTTITNGAVPPPGRHLSCHRCWNLRIYAIKTGGCLLRTRPYLFLCI